uniref:cyclin-dependent kinase n=1 Tax=Cannabis sativa TaxID=3483 RepID=A0A803QS88_CANSA
MDPSPPKSWSIHTRAEIIRKYEILERVGSGAYSDVYRARRLYDGLIVALKEVHDYQSAFREIETLQILQSCPNVVVLHEYFWREDEDAVLVLEFLKTDLFSVISEAKKRDNGGIGLGELKRWILQILSGVDACHRNMIVHRDLKPSNLLISDDGVLKLADFGQARILMDPEYVGESTLKEAGSMVQPNEVTPETGISYQERYRSQVQEHGTMMSKEEFLEVLDGIKAKDLDKETYIPDGDTSCLATCTTSDIGDDPFKGSGSYEAEDVGENTLGCLTSCVGTRWFRAPELLFGSTDYGLEVDLWSLGCIFAELFSLQPLFPGTSDIDQLSRIINVLGNLTEEVWPGCVKLPDFKIISFNKVENPIGLEACLPNRSPEEISIVKRLVCYDPASRATAMELLQDKYFSEEPPPAPLSELRVPLTRTGEDESANWGNFNGMDSESDEDFDSVNVNTTDSGFSIRFS